MIEFCRASAEAAALLAETRPKVWATTYRGIYTDEKIDNYDLAFYTERDRRWLEDPKQDFYLAMEGERCVGYFYYGPPHGGAYRDFALCLNALYFLREYRGRGLGRRVFNHMRAVCAARGLDKFFCLCNCHNLPAQGFYRKMGGIPTLYMDGRADKAEDQMIFEFYLGEQQCVRNP